MLYIVGTALGNIEDTSLRAARTISESEMILAEDTASFDSYYKRLQSLFRLSPIKNQKIVHYHQENEFTMLPMVIDWLKEEKTICLVSESGMPTVSDPGGLLLKYLVSHDIAYTVIPGPTAFATALVLSGFSTSQILFLGFLPKKQSELVYLFKQLIKNRSKNISPTVVFYESPHRINKTLKTLVDIIPDAEIAICREMTKKFEEVLRGKPKELIKGKYKGELTVVVNLIS